MVFCVNINFTNEGFERKHEIIELINNYLFEYVLNRFQNFVYNDLKSINEIKFKFKSKENPISYVQDISDSVSEYEINDILYGSYRMDNINDKLIETYNDLFSSINDNKIIIVISKKNKIDKFKNEKYYNIKYNIDYNYKKKIKNSSLSFNRLKIFFFNIKNEFIPKNTELINNINEKYPKVITKDKLWFKSDTIFKKPKIMMAFIITTKNIYENISNFIKITLFLNIIEVLLNKDLYDASRIDYNYNLIADKDYIKIYIEGFSENFEYYCLKVLKHYFIII